MEKIKIYQTLNLDPILPIVPSMHFPLLLEAIRQQAKELHTPD